jgi:hypothetical protein
MSILTGSAAAAPVSSFNYIGYGGFLDNSDSGFVTPFYYQGTPTDIGGVDVYPAISWGVGLTTEGPFIDPTSPDGDKGQSGASVSVTIPNSATQAEINATGIGVIEGTNTFVNGVSDLNPFGFLVHYNRTLSTDPFVGDVKVRYVLELYDGATLAQTISSEDFGDFILTFNETDNNSADPRDTFTFALGSGQPPVANFTYLNTEYQVSLRGFCTDQTGTNCPGTFFSNETETNTGWVLEQKRVVPEPSILALMSLGVIGLGVARRRA